MSPEFGANLRKPPGIMLAVAIIFVTGIMLRIALGSESGLIEVMQSKFSVVLAIESIVPYLLAGLWLGRNHGEMRHVVIATAALAGFSLVYAMLQLQSVGAMSLFGRLMLPFLPYVIATFLAGPAGFWLGTRTSQKTAESI